MDHLVRTINLFNKEVPIRKYGCKNKELEPRYIEPARLNLFIQLTPKCNANCKFCEYHKNKCDYKFNIEKLAIILNEIVGKINIGKLNFTGGEPTLDAKLFDEVAYCIKENIDFSRKPEVTVNTNGCNLDILFKHENLLDSIGLSCHHYDDNKNIEIFGTKSIATSAEIKSFQNNLKNKALIQMRCNLITGYIDSFDEVKKYLNHALTLGVKDCGFVTLMPLNQFCLEHQVDFAKIIDTNDPSIIKVNYWNRLEENTNKSLCNCANYVYCNEEGNMCKFYSRLFCNANLNEGQLTFDGEYLRLGFGGEIIF